MRLWIRVVATASLVACSGADTGDQSGSPMFRPLVVGAPAPAYSAHLLTGDSMHVGPEAHAPLTLLNIWATWCVPCRKEFPELQRLHERYAVRGLSIIGVSVDVGGTDDRVARTARALGATFPIARDADGVIQNVFRAIGVPETYLIGRDGTLLWRRPGDISPYVSDLDQAIKSQLPETR